PLFPERSNAPAGACPSPPLTPQRSTRPPLPSVMSQPTPHCSTLRRRISPRVPTLRPEHVPAHPSLLNAPPGPFTERVNAPAGARPSPPLTPQRSTRPLPSVSTLRPERVPAHPSLLNAPPGHLYRACQRSGRSASQPTPHCSTLHPAYFTEGSNAPAGACPSPPLTPQRSTRPLYRACQRSGRSASQPTPHCSMLRPALPVSKTGAPRLHRPLG
ncbi:uncharacterized protein B0H18DRAFT_893063, partial [Fomitopsis serialis]|uniref:uncharacterized protein n=1 Tax=Fomitopsis serialis TaxID=139415 RepID=UPI0020089653